MRTAENPYQFTLTAGCVGQDLVGGLGPDKGLAAFVPAVDESADRLGQVTHRGEAAAADGLPGDDREEELDQGLAGDPESG
jgi:hypothetical protein